MYKGRAKEDHSWSPTVRRGLVIQPSWLSREGTQIVEKIRREAYTEEGVAERQENENFRRKQLSRKSWGAPDSLYQYPYSRSMEQASEYEPHPVTSETTIPRLPQLPAARSLDAKVPSSRRRVASSKSGGRRVIRERATQQLTQSRERESFPELPGIAEAQRSELQQLRSSNDVVQYYVRNGHFAEVKLFHCNIADTGENFRPYDLVAVPRELAEPEHYTISVSGVVHVVPGEQSEFTALSDWMREQSIFQLLIQMRFFKFFLVSKMFHFWKSNVRHKLYCQVRNRLMKRLFVAKQTFVHAVVELGSLACKVQQTDLAIVSENQLYTLEEFSELQTTHRTGKAQPLLEQTGARMMKVLQRVMLDINNSEKNLRAMVETNPESQMLQGTRGGKTRSIVSLKQEKADRQKQYHRVCQEQEMLPALVRLADYMLCEALVGVVMENIRLIHTRLSAPNKLKGMFQTTVSFTDSGSLFTPTENEFQKVVGNLVEGVINVAAIIPRLPHMTELTMLFEERYKGPNPSSIIAGNQDFQRMHTDIGVLISSSFQQSATYVVAFEDHRPVFNFGKIWDMSSYEKQHHDVGQFRKDMLVQKEWRSELERMKSGSVVGALFVDSRALRNSLMTITQKALESMKQLMLVAGRQEASKVLESFKVRNRAAAQRPERLDQFCDYMEKQEEMRAMKKDFLTEAGVVDEMYDMLNEYEMKIAVPDQVQLDDLHESVNQLSESLVEAELFIEQRRGAMMAALDKSIQDLNESLLAVHSELHSGVYVQADADANMVLENISKVKKSVEEMSANAAIYKQYQTLFKLVPDEMNNLMMTSSECENRHLTWKTLAEWERSTHSWMNNKVEALDLALINAAVDEASRTSYKMMKANKEDAVVKRLRNEVEDFKQYVPLLQELANPALGSRHWKQIFSLLNKTYSEDVDFSIQDLLDMKVMSKIEQIETIGATASKEYSLGKAFEKMLAEWDGIEFKCIPYKDSGVCVIGGTDEVQGLLDDHIVKVQSMNASPFVKPIKEQAMEWQVTLTTLQDMLDNWLKCQSTWMYLLPIFSSEDIMKQMPEEGQKFQVVDGDWRGLMRATQQAPLCVPIAREPEKLERLVECNALLDAIQKGLVAYLEKKRIFFPRFFFLSNDEMLEILSETKDPLRVQPHLKKCFEGIDTLTFDDDLVITHMKSVEKEAVPMKNPVDPNKANGAVEKWLLQVEEAMFESIHQQVKLGLEAYEAVPREKWVLQWPGMVVLVVTLMFWTKGVEKAISQMEQSSGVALKEYEQRCTKQLMAIVELVRGELTKLERATLGALVVMDVHARDVVTLLAHAEVKVASSFDWQCQLRAYWEENTVMMRIMNAEVEYGYEYLGNSARLVITPLTDRCYRTLIGAIHLNLGGAPEGPAGTGKTETTKDLAKALARQCVVFNCSDSLDYIAMGKFFKGLASSGAWACFDEFNRIDLEVLSVVAQQVLDIQRAVAAKLKSFVFEGSELSLKWSAWCSITMNPGYAGRSELPDNLKALFRTVAMMVPDYAMISEIILYSFGYLKARDCAQKIVATYKLCSEQLSSQDHYDYGMRAVIAVLRAAGNLKRKFPDEEEFVLMLRSIIDVNLCKFLSHDVPLFHGIVSDLFPGVVLPEADYTDLNKGMRDNCAKMNLQPTPYFLEKTIQLYEMIIVRHGLMLVGLSFSGKTCSYRVLAGALTDMKAAGQDGPITETVEYHVINPKSITMGQLYGQFDAVSHEWSDGVLAVTFRGCASDPSPNRKWVLFDGPVDAIWIENMNTVLDDNKKLCLMNSEIIQMSAVMSMIFEVADLAVASPATVSRCGMVYLEPHQLGWKPLLESWLNEFPEGTLDGEQKVSIRNIVCWIAPLMLRFLRIQVKEAAPTQDANILLTLMRVFTCLTDEFYDEDKFMMVEAKTVKTWTEALLVFSAIWSLGGTVSSAEGRDEWHKFFFTVLDGAIPEGYEEFTDPEFKPVKLTCPMISRESEGNIYDYFFDKEQLEWRLWTDTIKVVPIPNDAQFAKIIIPTVDTTRCTFLLDQCVRHKVSMMFVGPTGTGKSVYTARHLLTGLPKEEYVANFLSFSAQTSSNTTQFLVDSKLDKRKKGSYGPPIGKRMIIMVDDLNMPQKETYGAQPPIELLRQYFDHNGWYDRDNTFRTMLDVQFVVAMGPPGGGRNHITGRFSRHFATFSIPEFTEKVLLHIFDSIMDWYLDQGGFQQNIKDLKEGVIMATLEVYRTSIAKLLPTPMKSHYLFNLRDFSRVVQGMLLQRAEGLSTGGGGKGEHMRLWIHEVLRVFYDRLVDDKDRGWFLEFIKAMTGKHLKQDFNKLFTHLDMDKSGDVDAEELRQCFYGDYMNEKGLYDEITEVPELISRMEEYLIDYNGMSKRPMNLAMFLYAVEHISRICRVLKQPGANMLLAGVGGSGRQSLSRLSSFISGMETFQIEISKSYTIVEWHEDLKKTLRNAGGEGKATVFLFSDTQIKDEVFVEDINNILNSGEVPNLFPHDEKSQVIELVRPKAKKAGLELETGNELWAYFIDMVKENLHLLLCFSPIGNAFRERLRQFPSLVNCCTIDWFQPWPNDALEAVALKFLKEMTLPDQQRNKIMEVCKTFHKDVQQLSRDYLTEVGRRNYVTPTSYLELLTLFSTLLGKKRDEVSKAQRRYEVGLEKLEFTAQQVTVMQHELTALKPNLIKTVAETEQLMKVVQKEKTEVVEPKKLIVDTEVAEAERQGAAANAIKMECEEALSEAMPALQSAISALDTLKPADIKLVQSFKNPPATVKLVMEAVCVLLDIKAARIPDKESGKMVNDYWEPSKKLLGDVNFMDKLKTYDKDNIPVKIIGVIRDKYTANEDFTPQNAAKASSAAEGLCKWVCAMDTYDRVAKIVAPKNAALAEATSEYNTVMAGLKVKQDELDALMDKLAGLEQQLSDSVDKKARLESEVGLCTQKLERAEKLMGGLGGEKSRWTEVASLLGTQYTNLTGDMLISAGVVGYLGAFTTGFRQRIIGVWVDLCKRYAIPSSQTFSLNFTLGDQVKIREWVISGLPNDSFSIDNAIMVANARRWPLMIDPQGQANKWVKNMEKTNNLQVVKLTDGDYLRTLENAIQFGLPVLLENVGEELDPSLEPLLLKQVFKQGGVNCIRLGDSTIEYSDVFRFYITTSLRNPHYLPETAVKVTLLNFMITLDGLTDQLLGVVVAEERPDLEEQRGELVIQSAENKRRLKEIEDQILQVLSESSGNILEDATAVQILSEAKVVSTDIQEKQKVADVTEKEIDDARRGYKACGAFSAVLFFCVADMANVDPMYQYSLVWFVRLFVKSISGSRAGAGEAEGGGSLAKRLEIICDYFTYSLYLNVCMSLFEKDKLLFSFLLTSRILTSKHQLDMREWSFLLTGGVGLREDNTLENPSPSWLSDKGWGEIRRLSSLPSFTGFTETFSGNIKKWKDVYDSLEPQKMPFPQGPGGNDFLPFHRVVVLRCLRPDKVVPGVGLFVAAALGQRFTEPPPFDLAKSYADSSAVAPLLFVLSPGSDPTAALLKFAEDMNMAAKLATISMGQGQGPKAQDLIQDASRSGTWVLLQNCHLAASWMPTLERLCEGLKPDTVEQEFRLWMTSYPTPIFPVSVLQNSVKMTNEPPTGVRANLKRTYQLDPIANEEFFEASNKPEVFKSLCFGLAFIHAFVQERRKYGPIGWNVPYGFDDGDLRISVRQLQMFIDENEDVPYAALKYAIGECNYGGRVTDDKDRRLLNTLLDRVFDPDIINTSGFALSSSGTYKIPPMGSHASYIETIITLPAVSTPEVFNLHDNADISKDASETSTLLSSLMLTGSRAGGGAGQSEEDVVAGIVKDLLTRLPPNFDVEMAQLKYPVRYDESMNQVLCQEMLRYNKLTQLVRSSLQSLDLAIQGLLVMSSDLETQFKSIAVGLVPAAWKGVSFPSLKPLASYTDELLERLKMLQDWFDTGAPSVFWLSGFFFTPAFTTAALQNYARKNKIPIDEVDFDFQVMEMDSNKYKRPPETGIYVKGLFFEGCSWEPHKKLLCESQPKVLFTPAPVFWLQPKMLSDMRTFTHYNCPVYRTAERRGVLATTGHSTNFLRYMRVPTDRPELHWILRGVCMLSSLPE
ncbi:hypothetical protein CYMTET_19451 [Cymbomonas tetramitiformis]|uniref:EF-hand domain-containing protein n=1 Tax=Cymbomonas tetramitiformis TaxID=36881 RepID=A0AAE0G6I9_9CHLO|nr:hypothetical protein CYMTET_19451 [Cymbomonas tetramitiformis]